MVTLLKAIREHMGFRPGQSLGEFMSEYKALSLEDRQYFVREYAKIGVEVEAPKAI